MSQITFDDFFAEEKNETVLTPLPSPLQQDVLMHIKTGEDISALQICEKLIVAGKLSNERYSTHKPKSYAKICYILDSFVSQGVLSFVEDKEKKDRIYRMKNLETGRLLK